MTRRSIRRAATASVASFALLLATRGIAGVLQDVPTSSPARMPEDARPIPDELLTEAERSDFQRTMTHAQVVALCTELAERSERVHRAEFGTSHEGRTLPMLVIADPPVTSAAAARADRRREVVLLFANIHAGEVCGKEALLMLAREWALAEERPAVLEHLIVAIVPNLNADGNERFSPDNRPGQDGPETMGIRRNAQDLDLNRDWVKLDAPETRAVVRFMNAWDPIVVLDSHTTNGSRHEHVITHQGPKHPAGDAAVIDFVRDVFIPAIDARFAAATPYEAFVYGNFNADRTLWTTYPAEPRYGAAYRGMRNRIGILCEAYSYATFRDRVIGTLEFTRAVVDETAADAREIRRRLREADRRTANAPVGTPVPLRVEARSLPGTRTVRGFQEPEGRRGPAGDPMDVQVTVQNDWQPTLEVPRPHGYMIPASHRGIAEHLVRHGIAVERLREAIELKVEAYPVRAVERSARPSEGRTRMSIDAAPARPRRHLAQPGDFVVRCDQPLGTLAAYLLEPMATDGLGGWGFIDVAAGDRWPILRLDEDLDLTTIPVADPDATAPLARRRVTWDVAYGGGDGAPNLSGSPARTSGWVDEEHFLQWRGRTPMIVHARSGRGTPRPSMRDVAAERLAAVSGIGARDARSLARPWSGGQPDEPVVFTHAGDLWLASPDAAEVRRLTRDPGEEQLPSLSPGSDWVAFTRGGDLFAVDVASGGERRLTTDGGEGIRNGRASWVYFEELFGRNWRAFWWSPDGGRIAFLRTDETPVPHHLLLDNRGRGREEQTTERERYPRPGDRNPDVTLHLVDPAGGPSVAVDLSDYTEGDFLVSHVSWLADGSLHVHVQDRAQTWLDVLRADARTGRTTRLFRDRTEAWIASPGAPHELADGGFLFASERSGWNHLYRYDGEGTLVATVTSGDLDVRSIAHVDEDAGTVLFTATLAGPVRTHLFAAPLDGGAPPVRLTQEPGSHRVSVSPDGRHFVDSWSSFEHPTRVALRDAGGELVRMIDDNPVPAMAEWDLGTFRHEQITLTDGVVLDATLQLPPGFDPSRRHPVWFMTYAGPQAPSVRMGWWGGRTWDHVLAAAGIVVFRADPYPASGQGAQSAWTAYRRLGERETSDIEQLVAWLCEHDWVDPERIGIAGHSYGGFMAATAMTRTTLFRAGIAGAPVTDWRLYDTIYTERYMGTLQDNPEGYAETSVVERADELHGRLLLAWGDLDDNVHPANAVRLLDRLVAADGDVVPLMYPGRRHGISSRHYRRMQYEFILDALSPEAGSADAADDSGEPDAPTSEEDRAGDVATAEEGSRRRPARATDAGD